jgi:hypothetical protein
MSLHDSAANVADWKCTAQVPRLEPVARIGTLDGAPEYTFGQVGGLRLYQDNRLLVLDEMGARLRVYDLRGKHLYSFGRSGSGPGEFEAPTSLSVTQNQVHVFDRRLQRYSLFGLNGDHVRTARIPETFGRLASLIPLRSGRWLAVKAGGISSEHIADVVAGRGRQAGTGIGHLLSFGSSQVDTLRSYQEGGVYWYNADTGVPFGGVPGFGNAIIWATNGDTAVAVVDAIRGRIVWYRVDVGGLKQTATIDLALSPLPVTRTELNQKEQTLRQEHSGIRRYGFITPDYRAHFSRVVLDDKARVWLERRAVESTAASRPVTSYLVVAQSTGRSFEISIPGNFTLRDVRNDLVAGTVTDDSDVQYVQLFRLRQ